MSSASFGEQHKHRRWEAYAKTVKRVLEGPPCRPKDIYGDPELELSRSTVTHNLRRGLYRGVFKKLDDGTYVSIAYKIPSETTTLDMQWQPQLEELILCIDALKRAQYNNETLVAHLPYLRTTLNEGYWDNELEDFFNKVLENPNGYEKVIDTLLQANPRNRESIEPFFIKKKDKIYDLVKSSGRHSILALSIFVDASDGREVLDRMGEDLKGEGADRIIIAAYSCGQKLYEKFGLDFKKFLNKALGHESKIVKHWARAIMKNIQYTKG